MSESHTRPSLRVDTSCVVQSNLCEFCRCTVNNIFRSAQEEASGNSALPEAYSGSYGTDLYPALPRLQQWANRGCSLCFELRRAALSMEARNTLDEQTLSVSCAVEILTWPEISSNRRLDNWNGPRDTTSLQAVFRFSGFSTPPLISESPYGHSLQEFHIKFPATQKVPSPTSGTVLQPSNLPLGLLPKYMPHNAADPEALGFIYKAMERCTTQCQHLTTPDIGTTLFRPGRLIDVRHDLLKIVPGASLESADLKYLTLSYTWGSDPVQLTLTESSEHLLTAGFSLDILAPIQKDTIIFARALAIPYVWIDALCIRQGDVDDWVRESSTMDDIYSKSFLTICAVSSQSCQEGFLERENQSISLHGPNQSTTTTEELASPYCIQMMPGTSRSVGSHLVYQLPYTNWARRAWTFQEDALSRRCVYFTKSGLLFRCSKFSWYEHEGEPNAHVLSSPPEFRHLLRDDFQNPESIRTLRQSWAVAMYHFSTRHITKRSDLLPALSGLARQFAHHFGSNTYAAGLWTTDLPRWLMWSADNNKRCIHTSFATLLAHIQNQDPYVVPSWSWVGCGQVVRMEPVKGGAVPGFRDEIEHHDIVARKLYVSCKLATSDLFGQLSSPATLFMETRILPLSDCLHPGSPKLFIPDVNPGTRDRSTILDIRLGSKAGPVIRLHLDCPCAASETATLQALTLALIGYHWSWSPGTSARVPVDKWPYGIVLYREADEGPYFRVGIFYVSSEDTNRLGIGWGHKNFFYWSKMETVQVI